MKKALVLTLAVLMVLAMLLTGCSSPTATDPTEAPTETGTEATEKPAEATNKPADATEKPATSEEEPEATPETVTYKQSPYLDDKGLPPVAERLPKVPKIGNEMPEEFTTYVEGKYGGTFRSARQGDIWDPVTFIMTNEPLLNSPGITGKEITANVLESYSVSDDGTTFTFKLREGLKWSDGEPVTMDDVKFAMEINADPVVNPGAKGRQPDWMREGGQPSGADPKITYIDDWTFEWKYEKPYHGLLLTLAIQGWRGYTEVLMPKHYLQNYFYKYTDQAKLDEKAKELDIVDEDVNIRNQNLWTAVRASNWNNNEKRAIGHPSLQAWNLITFGDVATFERNPYYFKVDQWGNQLPYIDLITSTFCKDAEIVNVKILAGEVDHSYEYATIAKLPLFMENAEKSHLQVMTKTTLHRTAVDISFILNYPDENFQKWAGNADFRRALSYAMDRTDMANTVYVGYAQPSFQGATQDLDKANAMLDELGFTKGADGFRTGPNGKAIQFEIAVNVEFVDKMPISEIAVNNWNDAGIKASAKAVAPALTDQRALANELEIREHWSEGPVAWFNPDWGQGQWGRFWNSWYTSNGTAENAIEPPAEITELLDLIYSVRKVPLAEAQANIAKVKQEMVDKCYSFYTCEGIVLPVVLNADIRNHSDGGFEIAQNFGGEMWFFDR